MTTKICNPTYTVALLAAVSLLVMPVHSQQSQAPAAQSHDSMAGMDMSGSAA